MYRLGGSPNRTLIHIPIRTALPENLSIPRTSSKLLKPNKTKANIPQEIWPNQSPHPLDLKVKTNPEGQPNLLRGRSREVTTL